MTEPDVALTDYAVALAGVVFAVLLQRGPECRRGLRFWLTLFFASVAAASLCGGTVHGFFLDERSLGHAILWRMTLLATGVTALATWAIGAKLLLSSRGAQWIVVAAGIQFVIYGIAALFFIQEFWIAVVEIVPAFLFLLFAVGVTYHRRKHAKLLLVGAGPALTLIAALVQQMGFGIHPLYFNHNALYHVLNLIALSLFFLGGRWLIGAGDHTNRLSN